MTSQGLKSCSPFSARSSNASQYVVRLPLGDVTKAVAQPGWKWSTHIKPLVGTELCTTAHFGVVTEGSLTVLQDGVETVCKAGDVF